MTGPVARLSAPSSLALTALASLALIALAACTPKDAGYVEIKTVPVAGTTTALYLDAVKLDPLKNGTAVLRQGVGTTKLATDGAAGKLALCDIVVRKNRITTVTVSVLDRPPRCQCRNNGPAADVPGGRMCVG
jgi:hypothetical protein